MGVQRPHWGWRNIAASLIVVDDLEQFVEFGGEDDFGAAVFGAGGGGVVAVDRDELTAAGGGDALRVDGGAVAEDQLHDGGGAHHAEIPVILHLSVAVERHVVGMAFDEHVDGVFGFEDAGQLFEGGLAVTLYFPLAGGEQKFLIHGDIHFPVAHFHFQAAAFEVFQGGSHLVFQGAHFGVFLVEDVLEIFQTLHIGFEGVLFGFETLLQLIEFLLFCIELRTGCIQICGKFGNLAAGGGGEA